LNTPSSTGFHGGFGTFHVTKARSEGSAPQHVIDKIGGADETRTRDLLRDRQAF
jgi:hypothetical protein